MIARWIWQILYNWTSCSEDGDDCKFYEGFLGSRVQHWLELWYLLKGTLGIICDCHLGLYTHSCE